ncbi:AAA family ATPase [Leucothrix mucor]|uniref:AAA family ATPase n=1 Tax=Leucothrix mucor TaxID=45248 RepID=UPI0003B5FA7F|nr:AAA family ATPase [Leucothrix mucor]
MATKNKVLRAPLEQQYSEQLAALKQNDTDVAPPSWKLSPRKVLEFIVGGKPQTLKKGRKTIEVEIPTKFFGDHRLVERAIVTLTSERALLLIGDPGTGKSWLSENLAAAISGNSTLTIQGTAGTTEEHIKYTWNIAKVIAEGYSSSNRIPSPSMTAMQQGGLLRFEEITRCVPDVQDSLVSILSEKSIAVPELPDDNMVWATPGFNVIATANSRDQGVNELSAALKRRFNYIHIPMTKDSATEQAIIRQRITELSSQYQLQVDIEPNIIELLSTVFRELRQGRTTEGVKITEVNSTLSTAESISVLLDAAIHAQYLGGGKVRIDDIAANLVGAVVKEDEADRNTLREYLNLVAKRRAADSALWDKFYAATRAAL